MHKKKLPIGIENYKEFHDKSYYYVDKTLIIRDLLDLGGKVTIFTRPRRFGKTLTLSMIRTFFEMEHTENGSQADNCRYFEGMKILAAGKEYTCHMGKYPVITLSLKSAKQPDYQMAYESLLDEIIKEYVRHCYVLESDCLPEVYRKKYEAIMNHQAEPVAYAKSLAFLSECLAKYHHSNTIVLLDEYDVPLENAFFAGFYDQMVNFIRSLFESVLKTNDNLEFAVITGCLRISKESIFTGLNNLTINSVLSGNYGEYFGFSQRETEELLSYYQLEHQGKVVKEWYDGYLFGENNVYNPWSLINYIYHAMDYANGFPKPYWSNTSSNNIVRELIERADDQVQGELDELLAGRTIEKPVHEDITYDDIYKSQDNLWNFLFFTGYLKTVSLRFDGNRIFLTLAIPNQEIAYIYKTTIREWFDAAIRRDDFAPFYQALRAQDTGGIEEFINRQLSKSISYHDEAERFYHGYLLGILGGIGGYRILSNREQGLGRPDLILRPNNPAHTAFVIEIKQVKKFNKRSAACDEALTQIRENRYALELMEDGYEKVVCYGICFCDKVCMVKTETAYM